MFISIGQDTLICYILTILFQMVYEAQHYL